MFEVPLVQLYPFNPKEVAMSWPGVKNEVSLIIDAMTHTDVPVFWVRCNTCGSALVVEGVDALLPVVREQMTLEPCSTTCGPEGAA